MYIPEINTYFVHIPKAGGTSVELFFLRNVCGYPDFKERGIFRQFITKYGGRINASRYHFGQPTPEVLPTGETQHLSAWQLKAWNDNSFMKSKYTFAFVRNPIHRFVSEVIWKRERLPGQANISFEQQIRNMQIEYERTTMKIRTPHNAPQYKFVCDEKDNFIVDDVFKLEEMGKAQKVISEKLGIDVNFGHENKTNRRDYNSYLNQTIVNNLKPLIKKDLEMFGYD